MTRPPIELPDSANRSRTLVVTSAGTFIALVAFTVPLANLPILARSLAAGPAAQSWILASMSLGLAAVLLTTGSLGDEFGRRRVFVAGAGIIAAGSVMCATATESGLFVAGRIVEGIGGAALVAASLSIVSHTFDRPSDRAKASGIWGASVGAGIAAGPLITAALALGGGWRSGYVLIAILGVGAALAGRVLLHESRADSRRPTDIVGTVLFSAAMVLLLIGLIQVRQPGRLSNSLLLFAFAAVLAAAFVIVESRSTHALLDPDLFRRLDFAAANLAAFATGAGVVALMSFACNFLINTMHTSVVEAAAVLFTWSATSTVTSLFAHRMPLLLQGSRQLAVGLAGVGIGQLMLAETTAATPVWALLPGLVIAGIASGILNAGLGRQASATAPPGRSGLGSGINNTARYLGSAIGVTIVSMVAAGHHTAAAMSSGWNHAAVITAVVSLVSAAAVALLGIREQKQSGRAVPEAVTVHP